MGDGRTVPSARKLDGAMSDEGSALGGKVTSVRSVDCAHVVVA